MIKSVGDSQQCSHTAAAAAAAKACCHHQVAGTPLLQRNDMRKQVSSVHGMLLPPRSSAGVLGAQAGSVQLRFRHACRLGRASGLRMLQLAAARGR